MNEHSASQMTTAAHAEPAIGNGGLTARRILILRTRLAGVRYHAEPEIFDRLRSGDALAFARESKNPHDVDAIRADWHDHPIGCLTSDHNHAPARLLDTGERLDAWIVKIDIKQRPKWPVAVDVFLAVPDETFTAARG